MARINEAKYTEMINALNTFASTVSVEASNLQSHASICASALGTGDPAVSKIYEDIKKAQLKYSDAVSQARSIAIAMQEELDEQKKEDQLWNGDGEE